MSIPFRVGETVHELGEFNDRATEVARVRRALRDRERLLVYGERRIGKSSVIRRAVEREQEERSATVIWLDLWSLTSMGDVLRAVLKAVPGRWSLRERFLTLLAGADVRPIVTAGALPGETGLGLGWSLRDLSEERARELLRATLLALDRLAPQADGPLAVVVDEFQQIESLSEGGGAFLRSVTQETGNLGYVLAGSLLSLVDSLTAPRGPFYSIPRLDIGPIEPDLMAPWIEEQIRGRGMEVEEGVGHHVLRLAGPSTEARVKLAREVFVLGMSGSRVTPDLVEEGFRTIVGSMTSAYQAAWVRLAEGHRRTLQILANEELHPTAANTLERYGVGTSSTVVRAMNALRADGVLSESSPARIMDTFFRHWVLTETLPPAPGPTEQ